MKIVSILALMLTIMVVNAVVTAQEAPELASVDDIEVTMVAGDLAIQRIGSTEWEVVPFTLIGIYEPPDGSMRHIYYSFRGANANWYIPVNVGGSICFHIRIAAADLLGSWLYRVRACKHAIEPDGEIGPASPPSERSFWVAILPGIGRAFGRRN